MEIVADLHLHSKYSRAVSPQMTLAVMSQYASQKGIDLLTAADWTHPVWLKEITNQLEETAQGVYSLTSLTTNNMPNDKETMSKGPRFILSTEISSIYKQGDKLRRIHNLVFAPSLRVVEKINAALNQRGCNLNADGRPIIGLKSRELLELILSIDESCFLIPCHVWTPHFGIYGSASGFDSLEEAFGELASQVYGIETGLSSDPDMNWSMRELTNRSILSFSDAHSPAKMAREATVFQLQELTYENLRQAIMQPMLGRGSSVAARQPPSADARRPLAVDHILYTIEFYPEEGKYHFSGHRNCKVSYGPEEIQEKGNICPVCHKKLTEGVLYRVQQLSGKDDVETAVKKPNASGLQWFTDPTHQHPPYVKLVPLLEIVAESIGSTVGSQKSQQIYAKLCAELTSELHVILRATISDIERIAGEKVAQGIQKVRAANIVIIPGYDGEYGKVEIWEEKQERTEKTSTGQLGIEW